MLDAHGNYREVQKVDDHNVRYVDSGKAYHELERDILEYTCLILAIITLVLSATVYMLLF